MDYIRFFKKTPKETQEQYEDRLIRSLNALSSTVQGSVAENDEDFESRISALEDLPVMGTSQSTASGTAWDFTGLPSWASLIIGGISNFSTNGTSNVLIQIGDSGGIENTDYLGAAAGVVNAGATDAGNHSTGFVLSRNHAGASMRHGLFILLKIDTATNTWVFMQGIGGSDSTRTIVGGGSKALSGTLDRVRLTTVSGDTGDGAGGLFNIWYFG